MPRARRATPLLIGIDTGGTFTDFVCIERGALRVHKLPSTPDNPARAVLAGLRELLGRHSGDRAVITYGSTVATNAVLERKGARVVLLTTAGFEDVLEIGRQTRPDLYALEPQKPAAAGSAPAPARRRRAPERRRPRAAAAHRRGPAPRRRGRAPRRARSRSPSASCTPTPTRCTSADWAAP